MKDKKNVLFVQYSRHIVVNRYIFLFLSMLSYFLLFFVLVEKILVEKILLSIHFFFITIFLS
jgi:hypothetical protein